MKFDIKKIKISSKASFSIISVLVALLIGAIFILISGDNPFEIYYYMIIMPISTYKNILNVMYTMTPLMLCALAFIIASKSGMINLGLEGQMTCGALAGVYVATLFPNIPTLLYLPIIFVSAMIVGGIWALIPAVLKLKFSASEIVTCIMMNYVAQYLINLIISGGYFKNETIAQKTPYILENAHMTSVAEWGTSINTIAFRGVQLNMMFAVAIFVCIMMLLFFKKTKFGNEIQMVGLNDKACKVNRINAGKVMLIAMIISGAIAGIAAMGEVLGTFDSYIEGFSPGYGFSGISVALLGGGGPIGVIFGALFFGILSQGMMYVGAYTTVPQDFVKMIQTLIIIFVVLAPFFEEKMEIWKKKRKGGAKE